MLVTRFPPSEVAAKIAISLGIGLLVGIEREWSNKDLGARTFALTALLGTAAALFGPSMAIVSFVGVLLIIAFANARSLLVDRSLEATTSAALLAIFVLGALAGQGHLFTPVAAAILMTMLLAWKVELHRFVGGLQPAEIRSAVLLGLLGLVVYPILPGHFIDRWELINPRQAWITVIVIAGIGFVNYVLLKAYGTRGVYLSGFLGGFVNSSAAAVELAKPLGAGGVSSGAAIAALLLTLVAMFTRNLIILAIFSPAAVRTAAGPLLAMVIVALVFAHRARAGVVEAPAEIHLESPVSLKRVLSFAALLVLIQMVSTLAERYLGKFGFLGVSVLGGLVSSASTSAAAANMVGHGQMLPELAGDGVVLASVASALINLPILYRTAKNPVLSRRLATRTVLLSVIGIVFLALQEWLGVFRKEQVSGRRVASAGFIRERSHYGLVTMGRKGHNSPLMAPRTLYEKIWDAHIVHEEAGQPSLIYIDRHLIHEGTSPQAFSGLKVAGRKVRRPELAFAVMDHSVSTKNRALALVDADAAAQFEALERNCKEWGINLFDMQSKNQGIVHVIGPELGITLPGCTIVCGDSHTATHGAFGALAFGIGTSEVEHVLATQCLSSFKSKTMQIDVSGKRPRGVTAKDIILAIIGKIGIGGGNGHVIEYTGEAVRGLSMEGRMTMCNMSIEGGARAGMVAPDDITFEYVEGRPFAPRGRDFQDAVDYWKSLATDAGVKYDATVNLRASDLAPMITWGTNPGMVTQVSSRVPEPSSFPDPVDRKAAESALVYMGLKPGTPMEEIRLDRVFIGSCTNSRIEDLRAAARVVSGKHVAKSLKQALVVPGSRVVKTEAEKEGLDQIFRDAGFEWRDSGCSMCIGMNDDVLLSGERSASTSNRNFEGRQGKGSRTHLVSPAMAAAAAIEGHFVDIRNWKDFDGAE